MNWGTNVGDECPWGIVQDREEVVDGVVWVSTASHGGFWLSKQRQAQHGLHGMLSAGDTFVYRNKRQRGGDGRLAWWEEDCDAPLVETFFGIER